MHTNEIVKEIEQNLEHHVDLIIDHAFHKPHRKKGVFNYIRKLLEHNRVSELLVMRGIITPWEHKSALREQAITHKPIGEILIARKQVTKQQLNQVLFRQRVIRTVSAVIILFSSFGSFGKKAHAGNIKDVPARIMLSSAKNAKFEKSNNNGILFGAEETKSRNLKAFTKWSGMFSRFDQELNDPSAQHAIQELKEELNGFQSSSIYEMAKNVNDLMNEQRYINDNKNWGKSDYWATPLEFMSKGGDCEDFAISKYVALRALGVAEEDMRIAIVQDLQKNIPHAVLVVYSERGTIILDNQIKEVRKDTRISHYKPIFSINRTAWWLHTAPQQRTETIVASAN